MSASPFADRVAVVTAAASGIAGTELILDAGYLAAAEAPMDWGATSVWVTAQQSGKS
jgi:hypothetical protein